ncbi:helicostatins [Lutzomyia longipalpis]|uniref:helicostatins n=1 Tax=Lutzomyia longipalpis TaxID=7200 RepID=UPI002483669B|nr:helicostatins [Lutzomyia longipalpis]
MRPALIPLFLLGGFCVAVFATSDTLNEREDGYNLNSLLPPSGSRNAVPLRDLEPLEQLVDKKADRYVFGLGRRSDPYAAAAESSGGTIKRLPMYNFGLGKRARPYAFGLGKRSGDDDEYQDAVDAYESWPVMYPIGEKSDALDIKRGRPYSFGLGKRYMSKNTDPVERRSASRYNFGLGKR